MVWNQIKVILLRKKYSCVAHFALICHHNILNTISLLLNSWNHKAIKIILWLRIMLYHCYNWDSLRGKEDTFSLQQLVKIIKNGGNYEVNLLFNSDTLQYKLLPFISNFRGNWMSLLQSDSFFWDSPKLLQAIINIFRVS